VRGAALVATAATAFSGGVTAGNRLGGLSVRTLASSPEAVRDGKVWLLLTSGVLADRPAVPSLAGFWIVGFVVLLVCPARVAAAAALGGHVLSALAVYGAIGFVRVVDPQAFTTVGRLADYGLSAIIAAWLGAIAQVSWTRHPAVARRALVVLGSLGCAAIGFALRADLTVLDSEHLVAYAVGVSVAATAARNPPCVRRDGSEPHARPARTTRARIATAAHSRPSTRACGPSGDRT